VADMHDKPSNVAGAAALADQLFTEQVTRYFNGPLEPGDLEALSERLRVDSSARRLFVQIASLDGLLTERSLAHKNSLRVSTDLLDDLDDSQSSLHDATVLAAIREEDVDDIADESVILPIAEPQINQSSPAISPLIIRISGAAAILLLTILVTFWATRSSPLPTVALNRLPITAPVPSPVPMAHLGAAVRAEWDNQSPSPAVGSVITDQTLQLKSGWVRLDFPSGVAAVVEAPARFSVPSAMAVKLELGKITADVPQLGHGFSIEAPTCRAVDLGTDFGVAVTREGQSEVQVFKGKVSFSATPLNSQSISPSPAQILTAGEGRRVTEQGGAVVATSANPAAFVQPEQFDRWIGASASNLLDSWRSFNEQLSRDPSLMLFYTFDDQDQTVIKNHAVGTAGIYDLPYDAGHGPTWIAGRRPDIPALDFNASKSQYLVLPSGPITQTGSITGCVWIKLRSYVSYGSIIKNWGNRNSGTFHLGIAGITHDLEIELDGTRANGPFIRDPHALPLDQWMHVAFVSDGTTVRLYRDGKQVASGPSRPIQSDPPMKCLSIGCKTDDNGITPAAGPSSGFWDGQIGEIALFNRALTADEIARMSEIGRP
jgi:hypothetical protein